jgi:hypothetical protein
MRGLPFAKLSGDASTRLAVHLTAFGCTVVAGPQWILNSFVRYATVISNFNVTCRDRRGHFAAL